MSGIHEFKVGRKALLSALKAPASVCGGRVSIPILSHVLVTVEGPLAVFQATDGDVEVSVRCPVEPGPNPVRVVLPPKPLNAIFGDLGEETATVAVDEGSWSAGIRAGRSRYRVNGMDPAQFPERRSVGGTVTTVEMSAGELKSALKSVDYAAMQDASRPLMASVCMEASGAEVSFVATDSRRLAVVQREATVKLPADKDKASAVLPLRAVKLLESMLGDEEPVRMVYDERTAVIVIGEPNTEHTARLATKLVEGKFPNWHQVVPAVNQDLAYVGREDLLMAIRRVSWVLADSTSDGVTLRISKGQLEVEARGDNGEASGAIESTWSGKAEAKATYNAKYLMEPLKALCLDKVDLLLGVEDPGMGPMVVRSTGERLSYVLMPIRLS